MRKNKNIISVSRRCDIPAYYSTWFNIRLKEEFVSYSNPFTQKSITASLKAEDVTAFVFWSKNFEPFLNTIQKIKKDYCFYSHFTINNYNQTLEKQSLTLDKRIETFQRLSDLTSPLQTIWRYDPIILIDTLDETFHLNSFETIAKNLSGYTQKCYLSFVNLYKKTRLNLTKHKLKIPENNINQQLNLTRKLLSLANTYNIKLYSCCNDHLLLSGIGKGHCIDTEILKEIYPHHQFKTPISPSRKECGCVKAIDIGKYNTCPQGCLYCYANLNPALALKNFQKHNIENDSL